MAMIRVQDLFQQQLNFLKVGKSRTFFLTWIVLKNNLQIVPVSATDITEIRIEAKKPHLGDTAPASYHPVEDWSRRRDGNRDCIVVWWLWACNLQGGRGIQWGNEHPVSCYHDYYCNSIKTSGEDSVGKGTWPVSLVTWVWFLGPTWWRENQLLKVVHIPEDLAQLVECLCSKHDALCSFPTLHKAGMAMHAYRPTTREMETGASEMWGLSLMQSKLEASLGWYMDLVSKDKQISGIADQSPVKSWYHLNCDGKEGIEDM